MKIAVDKASDLFVCLLVLSFELIVSFVRLNIFICNKSEATNPIITEAGAPLFCFVCRFSFRQVLNFLTKSAGSKPEMPKATAPVCLFCLSHLTIITQPEQPKGTKEEVGA